MGVEYFETFDDDGRLIGLVPRDEVHALGLWHRSVHVLLFNGRGELYVQRRAAGKDLCPGRWDMSVGEHLQPGESYLAGALRGLREELGIADVMLDVLGDGVRRSTCRLANAGVLDRELQQTFRGRHDGPVLPDPAEVAEVRLFSLAELADWVAEAPEVFTPWFLIELESLELLPR